MFERTLGIGLAAGVVEAHGAGRRRHFAGDEGRARVFQALLPMESLRRSITADHMLTGRVKCVRQGRALPLEMLVQRLDSDWELRTAGLQDLCRQGLSLVVNSLHADLPALGALAYSFERKFESRTGINAYWSHGRDSAFLPHADSHSVVILHLRGRKRWRLWGQLEPWTRRSVTFSERHLPKAEEELVLNPGDVLYIPRGDVHGASLVDGPDCLHLTISLYIPGLDERLSELGKRLADRTEGRFDPPRDPGTAMAVLDRLYEAERSITDPADLFRSMNEAISPRPPLNLGVRFCPDLLLSPAVRRSTPPRAAGDGGWILPAGPKPSPLSAAEAAVMERLICADSLTGSELLAALPERETSAAAQSLIDRSLVFALESMSVPIG